MKYIPSPVDTVDVVLPKELDDLIETLAKNIHDQWALGRMKEGWQYGPERDDSKKFHPDLIPYEELPDSEKEYDRASAIASLKLIIKFGYEIVKK